jgi:hypothetical protein
VHDTDFYLEFPSESAALEAAGALRDQGFIAGARRADAGLGWVTIASRRVTDEEFDLLDEETLPLLAARLGGEYDGFERTLD